MINFRHKEWESEITLSPQVISNVIIENPKNFYKYINLLLKQIQSAENNYFDIYQTKSQKDIPNANIDIITDLLSFSLNNRKLLTLTYKKLNSEIINSNLQSTIEELNIKFQDILSELITKFSSPLLCDDEIDNQAFFKLYNVKFKEEFDSLLEKLTCYIDLLVEVNNIKILFIMFVKSYFSDEDIKLLHQHCKYKEICLVFIDSKYLGNDSNFEQTFIQDNDLCELLVD